MLLSISLLVASDTCAKDNSQDKILETVQDIIQNDDTNKKNFILKDNAYVVDDILAIQEKIKNWTDNVDEDKIPNLLIISGGTGFAIKDVTPEAVNPLLQKHAPGLVHAMLQASLKITPFAMMARQVAGVRNKTVIITVPGSPKGCRENIEAIIKLLPHACEQAAGGNSRKLHQLAMKKNSHNEKNSPPEHAHLVNAINPHSCNHSHHKCSNLVTHTLVSNDISKGVTARKRSSPYEMISVTSALELIIQNTPNAPLQETMSIYDESIVGSVLAQDIFSPINYPQFPASIVDGYAVIASDGPGKYPIISISHAGDVNQSNTPCLKSGQIARITTGAPLPPGANSVVMVEETLLCEKSDDGKEEKIVEILAKNVKEGENIRKIGSDIKLGSKIFSKGDIISKTGAELGILASVGIEKINIYKKPTIGILSTGNELVEVKNIHSSSELPLGKIWDSNRISLISTARSYGYKVIDGGIVPDDVNELGLYLKNNLSKCDILITSGGVSMGELDLLKPTIERDLKGNIHFGRVAMKPGKPTTFATINTGNLNNKLIFALPGNPASCIVTFNLFVLPALRLWSGLAVKKVNTSTIKFPQEIISLVSLPRVRVMLSQDVLLDSRPEYHRVHLRMEINNEFKNSTNKSVSYLVAESTGGQRSSRVGSLKEANGLLCLPSSTEVSASTMRKGEIVDALLLDTIEGLSHNYSTI